MNKKNKTEMIAPYKISNITKHGAVFVKALCTCWELKQMESVSVSLKKYSIHTVYIQLELSVASIYSLRMNNFMFSSPVSYLKCKKEKNLLSLL